MIGHARIISIFTALLCGCINLDSNSPIEQVSCLGGTPYIFYVGGAWLGAGQNLFNIADPSNPVSFQISQNAGYAYYGDTTFITGGIKYTVSGQEVAIDTPIGSLKYPEQETLSGYPRHLAIAPGYIYFLRHITEPGGSNFCSQISDTVNELDVNSFTVNRSNDTSNATLLAQILLTDPTDIAIEGSTLFVLDGAAGLKVYSLSDPAHPALVTTMSNVLGNHIQLTNQSTLLVTSSTDIAQYDVSNPSSPALLGKIQ